MSSPSDVSNTQGTHVLVVRTTLLQQPAVFVHRSAPAAPQALVFIFLLVVRTTFTAAAGGFVYTSREVPPAALQVSVFFIIGSKDYFTTAASGLSARLASICTVAMVKQVLLYWYSNLRRFASPT